MFSFPKPAARAPEANLPLIARLTLYALGAVEGRRIRRPIDPVCAWLIRTHPALLHSESAPAAFTTIRARTNVVDTLIGEEITRARRLNSKIALWSFGGGFDARWYRLLPLMSETVVRQTEVEVPGLLAHKDQLLRDSPYSALWDSVVKVQQAEDQWNVSEYSGSHPLIVMEGLAGRLEPDALRAFLRRVRATAPTARIIIGLPGYSGVDGAWSTRNLHELGWGVETDVRLSPRGRLVAQTGKEICAGMHGLRVMRLIVR